MSQFARAVLKWFDQHGRKHLPWQRDVSPYRVWLSEIMLQQTQVSTVIPYFQRFISLYPKVEDLGRAPLDEVLHLWSGLGYYARARNLHKTAQLVTEQFQGQFPRSVQALQALPGIGRSTAGAICALAFGDAEPILDGNVKRVLTRYFAFAGDPSISSVHEQLWAYAADLLPSKRLGDYTQAMMDLGATVCTRSKPDCERCPLRAKCQAYAQGTPTAYPTRKAKKALPLRQALFLILQHHDSILLIQRESYGIWGGLWSLPECDVEADIADYCLREFGLNIQKYHEMPSILHTFTHFRLELQPRLIKVVKPKLNLMTPRAQVWYNPQQPLALGLPTPIKKILTGIAKL